MSTRPKRSTKAKCYAVDVDNESDYAPSSDSDFESSSDAKSSTERKESATIVNEASVQDITEHRQPAASTMKKPKMDSDDIIDLLDSDDEREQKSAPTPVTSSHAATHVKAEDKPTINAFQSLMHTSVTSQYFAPFGGHNPQKHTTASNKRAKHTLPPAPSAATKQATAAAAAAKPRISDNTLQALHQLKNVLGVSGSQHDDLLAQRLQSSSNDIQRVMNQIMDSEYLQSLLTPGNVTAGSTEQSPHSSTDSSTERVPQAATLAAHATHTRAASPSLSSFMHASNDDDDVSPTQSTSSKQIKQQTVKEYTPPTWQHKLICEVPVQSSSTTEGVNIIKAGESITFDADKCPQHSTTTTAMSVTHKARPFQKKQSGALSTQQCKRCQNRILRFRSAAGSEVGTMPREFSSMILPLLDGRAVLVEGIVIQCPKRLHIFTTIHLQISLWALPTLFDPPKVTAAVQQNNSMFQKETVAVNPLAEALYNLLQYMRVKPVSSYTENTEVLDSEASKIDEEAEAYKQVTNSTTEEMSSDAMSAVHAAQPPENDADAADTETRSAHNSNNEQIDSKVTGSSKSDAAETVLYEEEAGDAAAADNDEDNALRVSKNQVEALYTSAQAHALNLPEAPQPEGLKSDLRVYQRQALYWCIQREMSDEQKLAQYQLDAADNSQRRRHPLWDEWRFADKERTPFYINPFSYQLSHEFPEAHGMCRGGILADEMGMGKTVMSLALIVQNHKDNDVDELDDTTDTNAAPSPTNDEGEANDAAIQSESAATRKRKNLTNIPSYRGKPIGNCTTLVVCPMSLVSQWRDEVAKHTSLSCLLYYGSDRTASARTLAKYDVVITSYGTLASEYRAQTLHGTKSALLSVEFYRVMLDESHVVRNRGTENAKAVFQLKAIRRWCLTGTPIQNRLDDIFALLHYLQEDPWGDYGWWMKVISKPFTDGDNRALQRLKAVLHPLMLRRTKTMHDRDGNAILELPERIETVLNLEFSEKERDFYDAIFHRTKTQFQGFVSEGSVMTKYIQVLTMLLRLRQCCDHPFLILGRQRSEDEFEEDIDHFIAKFANRAFADGHSGPKLSAEFIATISNDLKKAAGDAEDEDSCCRICLSKPEDAVIARCGHWFCAECVYPIFSPKGAALCPLCKQKIFRDELTIIPRARPKFNVDFKRDWQHSAKTAKLMAELDTLRKDEPQTKCLIFSQWTSMLDLIQIPLDRAKYKYLRLDGTMSQTQREKLLITFRQDPSYTILLISLKAGGVGLNLVSANIVFFMDCWWNPAVEDQAIQRVHRIGQTKTVYVKRFIVDHTVEQRIIQLQERKKMLAQSVGMSADELAKVKLNDLQTLFSEI